METSIFLAKVLGIVCTISAAAVLVRYKQTMSLEKEVLANRGLAMFAAYTILVLGALMVASHNVWVADWRVVITLLGWSLLLKGVGRIFMPAQVEKMIERKQTDMRFKCGEVLLNCQENSFAEQYRLDPETAIGLDLYGRDLLLPKKANGERRQIRLLA